MEDLDKSKRAQEYEQKRQNCLDNAENFVSVAKKIDDINQRNIKFHLSLLALEEIGKIELLGMMFATEERGKPPHVGTKTLEDHTKKLFWALWGTTFGKEITTKNQWETYQNIANNLHFTRLNSLYVDINGTEKPISNLSVEDCENIFNLAKARLGMEKAKGPMNLDLPEEEKENIKWFLEANEDPEKSKLITGYKSQQKLVELGDVKKWISWLKSEFDKNDEEIKKIIQEELKRKKPEGEEALEPKYKIKIKIISESHSIRNKALVEWNKNQDLIKLSSDDKNTLFCTFNLSKAMPPLGLWHMGWGMARTFATALNIATKGLFWWNIVKDKARYYEEVIDVERNLKMKIGDGPILSVNFRELGWTLDEKHLLATNLIFYYITKVVNKESDKKHKAMGVFDHYALGLSFLAKNDIHLRFEYNAFDEFFTALRLGMKHFGDIEDMNDYETIKSKLLLHFNDLENTTELENTIDLGIELTTNQNKTTKNPITLTEVHGIKLYTDLYLEKNIVEEVRREKK